MKHFYFLFLFVISFTAFGQKYIPDRIQLNGNEYDYRFHHLEQYFNYYPDKRIVQNKDSTIVNRGYVAFYEIFENELYLRDIKIENAKDSTGYVSVREKFSPSTEERIPLRWVNGVIQIGLGIDDFKNDSLRPLNENNLIFEIQRGKVNRKVQFNKDEMRIFKNIQWNKFRTTNDYLSIYRKLQNRGLSESEINVHIYNNVLYYSKNIFIRK